MKLDLAVIVLTYNEEVNLPNCLKSLQRLDCDIIVVDSGSTDHTVGIAEEAGARVFYHPFESQARQLNWALENISLQGQWVLRIDADERLTPELSNELSSKLSVIDKEITGLYLKRRVHFMGRWIRHGGYYPTWLLRVWRSGCAKAEDRLMDEHMVLLEGAIDYLKHDITEDNQNGLFRWIDKHNRYAAREVNALSDMNVQLVRPALFGTPESRRRWLRVKIYNHLPWFIRPLLYFVYRYFIRMGFLDGKQGLIFHFLQACWYRFLVDAYLLESKIKDTDSLPRLSKKDPF